MNFNRRIIKMTAAILLPAMVMPITSCGTILYPERRHSSVQVDPAGRRIDPAVAVLDATCLLFFIIPGVVAFAVDFATGAIYVSNRNAQLSPADPEQPKWTVAQLPPAETDKATLEAIISEKAGMAISFDDKRMQAFKINTEVSIESRFLFPDRILGVSPKVST